MSRSIGLGISVPHFSSNELRFKMNASVVDVHVWKVKKRG